MNSTCPHCGVMLQPEPGFYQGAMYVSYAFGLGAIIVSSLLLYLAGNRSEWVYIGVVVALILFLAPVNYRASRIVYLYMFGGIKFDASR